MELKILNNQLINTDDVSEKLRERAIDLKNKSILITNFTGSQQEEDLSEPANCKGFGRIRHFKLDSGDKWPKNPLPIIPAAKALGINLSSGIRAQVFQNSVCNWRCWYCFVDFKLLSGNSKYASQLTCDEILDLYLSEDNPPQMIDLSGGQPDLTPEWTPWMMEAIQKRGLQNKIYLWSDDNLSNDYLWRYLSREQLSMMVNYPMYSRVCCFKGIDNVSFSLNTKAAPELFDNQFALCKRLIDTGFDLYGYITLTAQTNTNFEVAISSFLDKIQEIHPMLPLRIVPLQVSVFTPSKDRMNDVYQDMIEGQYIAIKEWGKEIKKRFSVEQISLPITEISLK